MHPRLFVWDDVEALAEFAPGTAFALALSKEQAIELIVEAEGSTRRHALKLELCTKQPSIYSEPAGLVIYGSS